MATKYRIVKREWFDTDDKSKSYKTIDNCSKKQYIFNSIAQEIGT